jgi:predicted membrane protein
MDDRKAERFGEQQDDPRQIRRLSSGPGRLWAGLFLLLIGGVLLLDQMGFPLPDWLFSWHVLLIAIGLFLGLRHNFRGGAWLVLILVGGCFVIQDFYPKTELRRFIAPCVLIFIGIIIMFRPRNRWRKEYKDYWKDEWREQMHQKWHQHHWDKRHWNKHHWDRRWNPPGSFGGPASAPNQPGATGPGQPNTTQSGPETNTSTDQSGPTTQSGPEANGATSQSDAANQTGPTNQSGAANPWGATNQTGSTNQGPGPGFSGTGYGSGFTSEDYIDTTSIFGGVHKKVVSKNFRGGDIVTFLGGSEIDLSQAEIIGTARLDVTQVMGGTKIIVPAHWEVRSEVTALFAGFEDKRQQPATINPEKVLIIDGTSIFGGIELKNY